MKFLCENNNTIFDPTKQILGQTDVYSERNKSNTTKTNIQRLKLFFITSRDDSIIYWGNIIMNLNLKLLSQLHNTSKNPRNKVQ